ncbi:MAG: NADH-quinone oxidoreductase subunit C [Anaerolineae bacterium]|nr:NADH-quinone oxidoreductase subunit C [Anaerolineae bacterium]
MAHWSDRSDLIVERVQESFPGTVDEVIDFRGERTLVTLPQHVRALCQFLCDELQFDQLQDIVADDVYPQYPRFAVSYHLYSLSHNDLLRVRALVEDPDEGPETVASVWPIATWLETEVYDLMGVTFKGNDKLRRLFLPEDWQGHPLRKDYPLGYEEVQFSFNWKAIGTKKPHPRQ